MGHVRGLGVRGLGDRQYKERLMTKYKIVSFLAVSPFTYEQLQRVSGIHRNTLRKNLDLLVDMIPLYGHKYYLLDCSQRQSDAYMNLYYNNKGEGNKRTI